MKRFSGLLLPGDIVSDRTLKFSDQIDGHGRRAVVSRKALERAAGTLAGKEINCSADFLHHDLERPIGRISHAYLVSGFLYITGALYPEWDFPAFVERVAHGDLGLSPELADVAYLDAVGANLLGIHTLTFTGAAVVKKSAAAWSLTDFRLADSAAAAVAA